MKKAKKATKKATKKVAKKKPVEKTPEKEFKNKRLYVGSRVREITRATSRKSAHISFWVPDEVAQSLMKTAFPLNTEIIDLSLTWAELE